MWPPDEHYKRKRKESIDLNYLTPISLHYENCKAHLILVHGLDGDSTRTFSDGQYDKNLIHAESINILSVMHNFPRENKVGSMNIIIVEFLQALRAAAVGRVPIIFIGHSLGGLIIKEILRKSDQIRALTRLVVFLGTPHLGSHVGSHVAGLIQVFPNFVTASPAIKYLSPRNDNLIQLHESFVTMCQSHEFECLNFIETGSTSVAAGVVATESIVRLLNMGISMKSIEILAGTAIIASLTAAATATGIINPWWGLGVLVVGVPISMVVLAAVRNSINKLDISVNDMEEALANWGHGSIELKMAVEQLVYPELKRICEGPMRRKELDARKESLLRGFVHVYFAKYLWSIACSEPLTSITTKSALAFTVDVRIDLKAFEDSRREFLWMEMPNPMDASEDDIFFLL
ncbi:Serine active site containing protein 1 [Physocladia obscura]|uniref:Serine active site containing protein 1 n=1 Tax=Physocladia obscura TaxID=109957 RepID=A0AAD5XE43_9FUNG|nr:Serine active site containing protein 1 [Physocladia obscura]